METINEAICLPVYSECCKELMADLPETMSREVYGIGPALTSDFLKECGCLWALKPDTHIVHVLAGLSGDEGRKLPDFGEGSGVNIMFETARLLRKEANDVSITPYKLTSSYGSLPRATFMPIRSAAIAPSS